jgi:hypothetical protein
LCPALDPKSFGTGQVRVLAILALLFFATVRFAIQEWNNIIAEVPMRDDSMVGKFARWSIQAFEFVWNGASGAMVAGVVVVGTARVR